MRRPRLLFGLLVACPVAAFADAPKPITCVIHPNQAARVTLEAGRVALCGLDLGSRNVKLSVVSLVPGRDASVREERQCPRNLGMGALVHDSRNGSSRALPDETASYLVETLKEYRRICGSTEARWSPRGPRSGRATRRTSPRCARASRPRPVSTSTC